MKEFNINKGDYLELSKLTDEQHKTFYDLCMESYKASDGLLMNKMWDLLGIDSDGDIIYYSDSVYFSPAGGESKNITTEFLEFYGKPKMKTVKDVVEAYPDGWPSGGNTKTHAFNWSDGTIDLCTDASNVTKGLCNGTYIICTREEYEQELAKTKATQWYDYEKQEVISLPPVGVECECSLYFNGAKDASNWNKIEVLYADESTVVGKILDGIHIGRFSNGFETDIYKFRPLDWNENKERDEFIAKCYVKIIPSNLYVDRFVFEKLYDAGARFK